MTRTQPAGARGDERAAAQAACRPKLTGMQVACATARSHGARR
ncbi:hypothetical protein BURMUCGD2M_6275 [Burkholderia multivorans CGD2M]|uniref:Uncharacterized protein n=1 Tax=Burkholderia multivorans CGD2 TaxID=513052 RepID=B9BNL8_9BURK|nr:hypothetical protein BURMUCGD2_6288 [Burkholderia multivorans CGD2]EEE13555.1 hypothetical protein BURMUCGD2M_6275 [Burkholderia multivorans CGD2M]